MASNSETSSGGAGFASHQLTAASTDIWMGHFGHTQSEELSINAATSNFSQGQPLNLPLADDTAVSDSPPEDPFVGPELTSIQMPVMNEPALDSMFMDVDGALLFDPPFLLPMDDHAPLDMMPTQIGDVLLHDPLFPQPMDDETLLGMMSVDTEVLVPSSPLQLPGSLDVMPSADGVLYGSLAQPPAIDATDLATPSWTASTQTFNPDPPSIPLFDDSPWFRWDHVSSADNLDQFLAPPASPFCPSDRLGRALNQSHPLVSGISADFPAGTNSPLDGPGLPQPPRQEWAEIQARASIPRKRPLDQAQSSTQSPMKKRLATIQPKPLPMQPSAAGSIPTTSNPSPKVDAKQANIPADMLTTFKLKGLASPGLPEQRTRSTKVCLRCRTLRQRVSFAWIQSMGMNNW